MTPHRHLVIMRVNFIKIDDMEQIEKKVCIECKDLKPLKHFGVKRVIYKSLKGKPDKIYNNHETKCKSCKYKREKENKMYRLSCQSA